MNYSTQKISNWHLLAICIALAIAALLVKPAKAQTYSPFSYWTFENALSLKDSMNVFNLDPNYYQSTYAINNNAGGVGVGKYMTLNTTTTSIIKGGIFGVDSSFTIEFLFRPGQGFNVTNFFGRFDGAIGARMDYPNIHFYTTITSNGQAVFDELLIPLDGIGKKEYGYYVDGGWHHFVFRYSANTGLKQVFVDGTCPSGFSKTTATGYFPNTASVQRDFYFNSSSNYLKVFGDMDEIAIYKYALHPNMIYQHYQNAIVNHQHYSFNWTSTAPPAAGPVTAGLDPDEYGPGHPNYTVTAIDQLKSFPTPRYKPGHTLLPNFSWMDQSYFGGWQSTSATYAQAVANSLTINMELAKNFNFNLVASQNTTGYQDYNDLNKFSGAWVNQCNQNPQYPCAAITFWAQIRPNTIGKASPGPYIWSTTMPNSHYLRNSSGQFIDKNGNVTNDKYWSPAAPLDSIVNDGLTQKFYMQSLLNALTRPLNYINDNGEVIPLHTQNAMAMDPAVVSDKNSTGLDWATYQGNRKKRVVNTYRDQFMTLPGLANTKFLDYQLCGQSTWSHKFSETRFIQTPINGIYYSTPDVYVRYPNNWRNWQGAWHGWQWVVESRNGELPLGDKYFSPFVSPGWDNNDENNVRPAQYLGLLKCMAMVGAEFYFPAFFNIAIPYANPASYAWQAVMPALAQGVTSRYEDLFRNGTVMNGDIPSDYINPVLPGYSFKSGDLRKLIVVRKSNTVNRYAITGTIQPNNSMLGGAELTGNATITLDGQNITFRVRRQGSTYVYDKTNASAPVFYQLDEWHENKHPYKWTRDFNIEAELFDNTNSNAVIKTYVPAGTPAGNFTNFTSAVAFNSVSSVVYNFTPRGTSTSNYYLWVRMRSKDGSTTGLTTQLDNNSTQVMDCVRDTNWTWYRINTSNQQNITYSSLSLQNHTLTLTPTNTKLEIDKITISTNNAAYPNVTNPCSGAIATITPSGSTTICPGGSVTLTANAGTSYSWSNGATTQSINVTSAGTFTVNVVTASGSATSSPVTVTVTSAPTATITANGPTSICQGSTVTLTASSGTSYLWSNGATTQAITVGSQGSYNVKVTNAGGCSATSSNTNVIVNTLPTAAITAGGSTTFCQGGSVNLTASSGSSYLWTPGNQTTQTINVTAGGSYSVKVTNASGCSANSVNTTVTVNSLPVATITANGPTSFPSGGSVVLTASSGSSYLWSPGGQTTQSKTVTSSGTYTVRVTNSSGCSATSAGTVVSVTTGSATITASGPTTFCQGGSVVLTATTGSSYSWSNGANTKSITVTASGSYSCVIGGVGTASAVVVTVNPLPSATISASGPLTFASGGSVTLTSSAGSAYLWSPGSQTTQSISVNASGTYTVRVTNSNGCSATSAGTVVTVTSGAANITASGPLTFCQGGSVTLTASTGSSYSWSNGANTKSITVTTSGSYSCVIGGVGTAPAKVVTVNPLPTATITASGSTSFCSGGSVTLTASSGSSYLWSPGNQTTQSITVTTAGNYSVRVTNASGCSNTSAATNVTVTTGISANITASGPLTFCQGGNVTLYASGGSSYVWLPNGQNANAIFITTSGTYTVTAYSGSCSATSTPVTVLVTNCTSCPVPTGLTTTSISRTKATLNWGQSIVADTFEVKLQNMVTGGVASGKFVGSLHSVNATGLTPGRTYNWWVRSICGGTVTAWSATAAFTTPYFRNSEAESTGPFGLSIINEEGSDLSALIDVYPNPANDHTTISINALNDVVYEMELSDFTGKLIKKDRYACSQGENKFDLQLLNLPKGVYLIRLMSPDGIENKKLVLD